MFKRIVFCMVTFLISQQALAGWSTGGYGFQDPQDGELMLTIWNSDSERSVSIDLGASASQFVAGRVSTNQIYQLDPADLAYLGDGDISWNLVGNSTLFGPLITDFDTYGVYFTAPDRYKANYSMPLNQFLSEQLSFEDYKNRHGASSDASPALVNNSYRLEGALKYAGFGGVWGETAGGIAPAFGAISATAKANEILNAWSANFASLDPARNINNDLIQDPGFWALDLNSATLTYYTPIPASAYLFGSALFGIAAIRKRRAKLSA